MNCLRFLGICNTIIVPHRCVDVACVATGLVACDCTVSHTDVSLDEGMYDIVSW